MKMDSYVTQFCKTLKAAIAKSKYKEVLEKTEKFIHRQASHFSTCQKGLIIRFLYLQSYSCHKIILKALMDTNSQLDKFYIKVPLKIMLRNLSLTYKIVEKLLKSHQIIINFSAGNQQRFPYDSYNRSNTDYQKPFSYLLETVTWVLKDFTLVQNIKGKGQRQKMLEVTKKLISLMKDCGQKKKIRLRINQLEVKVLILVSQLKLGNYSEGSKYCQQLITQVYQFLFHLNHKVEKEENPKYRKAIRKCYKLLLICFIQQSYFHIFTNTYHPLQALIMLMKKIQNNPGPRQMIKYYDGYTYVVDQFQLGIKAHDELNKLLSNFQFFQLNTINSIVDNNTLVNLSPIHQHLVNESIKQCQSNLSIYQLGEKRFSDEILEESSFSSSKNKKEESFYRETRFKKQANFTKRRFGERIQSFHKKDDQREGREGKIMNSSPNSTTCGKTFEMLKGRENRKKLKRLPSFQLVNGYKQENSRLAFQSSLSKQKIASSHNFLGRHKSRLSGTLFEQSIKNQKNRLEQRKTYQGLYYISEGDDGLQFQAIEKLIGCKFHFKDKIEQEKWNGVSQKQQKKNFSFQTLRQRQQRNRQSSFLLKKSYKQLYTQTTESNQKKKTIVHNKFIEILLKNKQNLGLTSFSCKFEAHIKRKSNRMEKKRLREQNQNDENYLKRDMKILGSSHSNWGKMKSQGKKMQACTGRDNKNIIPKQNRSHGLILDIFEIEEDLQRCYKRSLQSIEEVTKKVRRKREVNKDKKSKCFFLL